MRLRKSKQQMDTLIGPLGPYGCIVRKVWQMNLGLDDDWLSYTRYERCKSVPMLASDWLEHARLAGLEWLPQRNQRNQRKEESP